VKQFDPYRIVGLIVLLAGAALGGSVLPAGAAPTPADHPVSWYVAHPTDRQNVLRTCNDDRSLDDYGDCRNATAAAAAAGDESPNGKDAFSTQNTVAGYKTNGFLRGMILGACKTNRPPPEAYCEAAREAQRDVVR
jgi:hypothetical protein